MYTIAVKLTFNSAHRLREYEGKCENLHGHNWDVEIVISAKELNKLGMVIDFKVVKDKMNNLLKRYDHTYLNELDEFTTINPTSENIAKILFEQAAQILNDDRIKVTKTTVWETLNNKASYKQPYE